MRRTSLPVVLAVLLASCAEEGQRSCPGEIVATLAFTGTLRKTGQIDPAFDPVPALTDCSGPLLPNGGGGDQIGKFPSSLAPFRGSLAAEGGGTAAALCRADGAILFGTRTGDLWVVANTQDGAVLGPCDPTCAARSRVVISGDVVAAPSPSFGGALVEVLTQTGGGCGACVLPCAARYELTGSAEEP